MDNRLIPADTRLREEPADQMEVYLGRSLDALDAILENCMASMERLATGEQQVDCGQTVQGSLEYLSGMTDDVKGLAPKSLDDMAQVNGVGPAKLKEFGIIFLEALADGVAATAGPDGA